MAILAGITCLSAAIGWAQTAEEESKVWNDFMKGIEIGPGKLDIGGSLRMRFENLDGFTIKRYGDYKDIDSDHFLLERLRLDFDYKVDEDFNIFVQFQDAHFWDSNLDIDDDFGPVCAYENPFDLKKAYVDWKHIGDSPFGFRFGRQAIFYRDKRAWGPGDWGNTGRYTWDALKLYIDTEWALTDLIAAKRVISDKHSFDNDYWYNAYGVYSQIKQLPFDLDLLYIFKDDKRDKYRSENGAVGDLETHSLGMYLNGKFLERFDWGGFFAYQFGDYNDDDIQAFGANAKLGYTFDAPWQPRFGVEFSYGSGDDDPTDGNHETFDGLFGAVDTFYGRMNMFGWMNLEDYQAAISAKPYKGVNVSLDYHYFRLAEDVDGWYYCHGGAIERDATGQSGSGLGHELDFLAKWRVNPSLELFTGYSHFFPDTFTERTGNLDDADWVFLQATFFF